MSRRVSPYHTSTLNGLTMRAGRAHEDPVKMAAPATMGRGARMMYRVLQRNPDLTEDQAVKAAMLLLRAEMAKRAQQSAAARKARAATGREPGATGLEDCGSDGIDA